MGFGQVLVLAHEIDRLVPEVSVDVRLDSSPYPFTLSNVDCGLPRLGVSSSEEIYPRAFRLFSGENALEFTAGASNGLACPIRQLCGAESLGIPVDQEDFDCRGCHAWNPYNY